MTFRKSVLIFCLSVLTAGIFAQVEERVNPERNKTREKLTFSQRLVFGGDIGLSFGSITYIKIAPSVGYRITDRLTAGLGPIYIYEKYKLENLESSTYGGRGLVSFTIFKGLDSGGSLRIGNILLHAENEVINLQPLFLLVNPGSSYYYFGNRVWIDNFLIGAGISQPISGKFSVSMYILWDITRNKFSPYTNPVFKFGFNF